VFELGVQPSVSCVASREVWKNEDATKVHSPPIQRIVSVSKIRTFDIRTDGCPRREVRPCPAFTHRVRSRDEPLLEQVVRVPGVSRHQIRGTTSVSGYLSASLVERRSRATPL
jgi:hypothetical protein